MAGDFGDDLKRAGAGADDSDTLARKVDAVGPLRRVKGRAGKAADTGDIGQFGRVELADGADHGARGEAAAIIKRHLPVCAVPVRCGDFGAETDVLVQAMLGRNAFEIILQHIARRITIGPFMRRLERVAVEMVGRIDPDPGVAIGRPGAADPVLRVDDGKGHAGFLQRNGGEQPRHAGADNDDGKRRLGRGRRIDGDAGRAGRAIEMQFAGEQIGIFGRHLVAGDEVHGTIDRRCRRTRQGRAAGVAPSRQMVGGERPGLRLFFRRDAAIFIAPGADIGDRHRKIIEMIGRAGEMDERCQQRRNIGVGHVRGDRRLAVAECLGHGGMFPLLILALSWRLPGRCPAGNLQGYVWPSGTGHPSR